jgi:hypothetical protein
LQIVAKGKSIFAQHIEKMKVNEPSKQMLDAHETCEQADTEIAKHQFGKESLYIICTLIH